MYLIETKVYSGVAWFENGKKQLAYNANSLQLKKALYLVFLPKRTRISKNVKEHTENLDSIEITSFLIEYDDTKW